MGSGIAVRPGLKPTLTNPRHRRNDEKKRPPPLRGVDFPPNPPPHARPNPGVPLPLSDRRVPSEHDGRALLIR